MYTVLVQVFFLVLIQHSSYTLCPVTNQHLHDAVVHSRIKGTWKSIGGGYLLDTRDTSITLYSYTSRHCYTEQNDYLSGLLNNHATFSLNRGEDTLSVYLQDFGKKTTQLQPAKKFYRLSQLPPNCKPLTQQQRHDPEYLFELFWLTLKENYAYAAERKLNWDQVYSDYRPKISVRTTQEELFSFMGEIVTLTKDQHTKIISRDGKTIQYSGVPTALRLREIFDRQDSAKDFNAYINSFFQTTYHNISNDLLRGKGRKVANGKIEYGDLTPAIGYIHIHSLTGFAPEQFTRRQQVDTLDFHMSRIIQFFREKKSIILDVSLNFGGYDAAGLTITGYFTTKPFPVYTLYSFSGNVLHKNSTINIYPSSEYSFTGPVYVVTSDISRSAAETFVMQMKALQHIKVAGTRTLGITSDMLGKSIGDYYLTISNEKYITPKGDMFEVKGVPPDIPLEIFPAGNMFNGHRDAIRTLINIISGQHANNQSK